MRIPMLILIACTALGGCSGSDGFSAPYSPYATERIDVVMPPNAPPIGQQFRRVSDRRDTGGQGGNHLGMDVLAPKGTPVLAAAGGVVTASFYEPAYGNRVEISHGTDAQGRPISTRSVHLDRRLVATGDRVARGQQIGTVGSTGALAGTLNHLHFELHRKAGGTTGAVDPHRYWADGIGRVTCFDPARALPDAPVRLTYPLRCR